IVVVGTLASDGYAGMAWMQMQITAGLKRLGHDVYYFETTSAWPYDPIRGSRVCDSDYTAPYLARVAARFGLGDGGEYRRSSLAKAWLGMDRARAEDLLAHADAVLNIAGATPLAEEGLKVSRLVYFGTDPVLHELTYARGDTRARALVDEHDD